jgi:hypothetical protein
VTGLLGAGLALVETHPLMATEADTELAEMVKYFRLMRLGVDLGALLRERGRLRRTRGGLYSPWSGSRPS